MEIISQLQRREHSFIDDGTRRERHDIECLLAGNAALRYLLFDALAEYIEFRFERLVGGLVGDEYLFDVGFCGSGDTAESGRS